MNDYLHKRLMEKIYGKQPVEKKPQYIRKKSLKREQQGKEQKEKGTDNSLDLWFEAKRKQMTGKCFLCGGKSEKANDETYRRSIHHILEKRKNMFHSVSNHEDNWLEVCFFENSCQQNIHGGKINWELLKDSKEWEVIQEKLLALLPMVAENEKKNKLYDKLIKLVY